MAVITTWPNVAPEEIETQVTRPIEESVSSAANLYAVDSNTTEGSSLVRVQFQWGTDIGQAAVDMLQLVERAPQSFPIDPTLQTPTSFKFDPTQLPILIFGVSGGERPGQAAHAARQPGHADHRIRERGGLGHGHRRPTARDHGGRGPDRCSLTTSRSANLNRVVQENVNLPAGIAKQGKTEYTIRSLGWFTSPAEMAESP